MTALRLSIISSAIILTLCPTGCRKSTDTPVPRPVAYPRIEVYPAIYDTVTVHDIMLPVNKGAVIAIDTKNDSNAWINVTYPRYHATLRYTASRHSRGGVTEATDNRLTRMSLNAGGNTTEILELQNPAGIASTIFVTPGATVTPVQILSTDSTRFVISGVLEINSQSATREEIAPVVAAVKEDLIFTAKHISTR